jgi:hypothetical protein
MAGETVVEAMNGKGAASADEMLFAILSLVGEGRELGPARERKARLLGLIDGDALFSLYHDHALTSGVGLATRPDRRLQRAGTAPRLR